MREAMGPAAARPGTPSTPAQARPWGAPAANRPDCYWRTRGDVNPSVARYLDRWNNERRAIAQVQRWGGPAPTEAGADGRAAMRAQAQQEAQLRQQRHRNDAEFTVSAGMEMVGVGVGVMTPEMAILMTGARVAINLIDPSGALGL